MSTEHKDVLFRDHSMLLIDSPFGEELISQFKVTCLSHSAVTLGFWRSFINSVQGKVFFTPYCSAYLFISFKINSCNVFVTDVVLSLNIDSEYMSLNQADVPCVVGVNTGRSQMNSFNAVSPIVTPAALHCNVENNQHTSHEYTVKSLCRQAETWILFDLTLFAPNAS